MSDYEGVIGVVGNCASGKTTLVKGLNAMGFHAVNIAQEHSMVQRLWQRKKPDFLVCLSCTLATAQERREIYWTQERLDDQWQRLVHARAHCDFQLATDGMSITQVLEAVVSRLEQNSN